jgi:hypothetical protein
MRFFARGDWKFSLGELNKEDAPEWGILLGDVDLLLGGNVAVGAVDGGGKMGTFVTNLVPLLHRVAIVDIS